MQVYCVDHGMAGKTQLCSNEKLWVCNNSNQPVKITFHRHAIQQFLSILSNSAPCWLSSFLFSFLKFKVAYSTHLENLILSWTPVEEPPKRHIYILSHTHIHTEDCIGNLLEGLLCFFFYFFFYIPIIDIHIAVFISYAILISIICCIVF